MKNSIIKNDLEHIQHKIYTINNLQVMLDSDLADFYGIETKRLNQQVKRNIERFPAEFMFQLSEDDLISLRLQNATSESKLLQSKNTILENTPLRLQNATSNKKGGRRYIPYVFTEQGVAMLSTVLHTKTAVNMSIQIMKAFVVMRRFVVSNALLFQRLDTIEKKILKYEIISDKKFEEIFDALDKRDVVPKQGIFFDGQVFDAYKFVCSLIRKAKKTIVLIDNYIDETVLDILTKRNQDVTAKIYTKKITRQLKLDLVKNNEQYQEIEIKEFEDSHDRFLIIDNIEVYHIGASLKDLGKKWFAFSKMDIDAFSVLSKLKDNK